MNHDLLPAWHKATGELPWGVQTVLHDTLSLVAQGEVTLVHSADYSEGSPCLINSVGQMLAVGGGHGIPTQYFGPLVHLFDVINREFQEIPGYNNPSDHKVSPEVGYVLLHNFAPLKPKPIEAAVDEAMAMEAFANHVYVEPKDEDLYRDWLNSLEEKPPVGEAKVVDSAEILSLDPRS